MEQEIDLRPYIQAVLRQWRVILGLLAIFCAIAVVNGLLSPRPATARGDLLLVSRTSQLALDPRFTERDATMFTNPVNQRQALIDLATSSALEARVAEELQIVTYAPGQLLAAIRVSSNSDLLRISAVAPTVDEALTLAEAWTRTYEALVNELYSGRSPQSEELETQVADAQQRFDEIQSSLDSFYAGGELVQAGQQVARLEGLLTGGVEAQVSLYTQYLTRTQELSLILEDARALQAQYVASEAVDLNGALAALAVRARVAGAEELPVELSFASAEGFTQAQANGANLERFVSVLETERDRMVAQADALARDLAAGNAAAVGLPSDERTRYEAELARAKGALARAEGQEELLLQRRDVALTSLEVLQAKSDEGQIAQAAPEISVRYVGVSTVPPRSLAAILVVNLVAAGVAALVLALLLIIGRELMRHFAPGAPTSVPAPAGERAADRPVASD